MTSPSGSTVTVTITGNARTGSAFARVRADLARLVATVRLSGRRMSAGIIAGGGIGAVMRNQMRTAMAHVRSFASAFPAHIRTAVSSAIGHLSRFGRSAVNVTRQLGRMTAQVGMAVAPYALLAAKAIAVTAAVAALTGVLGNGLGIIQLIAPAAIAGGAAMAVFKMALSGVGEALKAGIEGDAEKFKKELDKLPWSARQAVLTLLDLRKEWVNTQKVVQNRFFAGFREDVIDLSRALQPVADRWLPKIADAFAAARFAIKGVFTQAAQSGQLDKIMEGVTGFFQNLALVVQPFAKAFLDVAEVAAPKFKALGKVIADLASSFRNWISGAKESGQLTKWLDKAWETFGKLWEVVKNLGTAIAGIFQATSDGGDSFLDNLVSWTQQLSDWVNSGDGQALIGIFAGLISFLSQSAPVFGLFLGYLKILVAWWGVLAEAGKAAWTGIVAAFRFAVFAILAWFDMLLQGAAKAFGWMPGIGPKLKQAAKDFSDFKDSANNALNGIKKTVDVYVNYHAVMIGNHLQRPDSGAGEYRGGGGHAHGGNASGTILAGERGPELIDVGGSAHVSTAGETRRRLEGSPGGGGTGTLTIEAAPNAGRNWLVAAFLDAVRYGHVRLKTDKSNRVVIA